jgi:hypothetical protein
MVDAQKIKVVTIEEVNRFAANLFLRSKSSYQVKDELRKRGLDEQTIEMVIENAGRQVIEAKMTKANKDLLYGA